MSENESIVNIAEFGADLNDVFEPLLWTDPEPVQLAVKSARAWSKDGRGGLIINLAIVGEVGYDEITEFISMPKQTDTPRQIRANRKRRAGLAQSAGFEWSDITDPMQLVDYQVWARLGVADDRREGGKKNVIMEYVTE